MNLSHRPLIRLVKQKRNTTLPLKDGEETSNSHIKLKSLIMAQIERWRNALHMQVERQHGYLYLVASGERVSNISERIQ